MHEKKYMEVRVNSMNHFDTLIRAYSDQPRDVDRYIYRGVSDESFNLLPSIYRSQQNSKNPIVAEYMTLVESKNNISDLKHMRFFHNLLYKFTVYSNQNGLTVNSSKYRNSMNKDFKKMREIGFVDEIESNTLVFPGIDTLSDLSTLQHYGVPTDLLDFSFDLYTALYFSIKPILVDFCENKCDASFLSNKNIALWIIDTSTLDRGFNENGIAIKTYVPNYSSNPNLYAQKGVFLYCLRKVTSKSNYVINPFEEIISSTKNYASDLLTKIVIPATFIPLLYNRITYWGYGADRLFPGYYGIEQRIREDIIIQKIADGLV